MNLAQRLLPDAGSQSRHGVSDVLYLPWLFLFGMVGEASARGINRNSLMRRVGRAVRADSRLGMATVCARLDLHAR